MYNICFKVAATGFLAVLLLYLHIEYPKASEGNLRYRQWVAWILISEILDVIAVYTTDHGTRIAPVINILVNTAYFMATAWSFWYLANMSHEIRVRQVMMNIINNAIKYTEKGGVTVKISFERLKVVVSDTGMGIREENMDRLFQSFKRLDETKNRNVEGTGLGLSITKNLVEMMEGRILAESKYGAGSTFRIEMAQKVVKDEPIGDYTARLERVRQTDKEYRPSLFAPDAKVLVVDDNDMNLEVITELLKDTGMQTETATCGPECLEALKTHRFDLVLLDQMMPGMSGTETLQIMKEKRLAEGTPIIILTADAIAGAKESYLAKGFTDYLSKPVILVISELTENLNAAKSAIAEGYKGVFVKNEAQAQKYMAKHEVKFVLRDGM